MKKISDEELLKKCNERNNIALEDGIPEYYRFPDVKFIKDFLKDIYCDEYYFRDNDTRYYFPHMFKDSYTPIVDNGGQIAHLDTSYFEIRSKDKRLVLNLARPNSSGFAGAIYMVQTCSEGLYSFTLFENKSASSENMFNCQLFYYPSKDLSTSGRGFKIVSDDESWNAYMIRQMIYVPQKNLVEEDIAKIANKIYRNGLPHLHQMAINGDVFEITSEDRAYYDEIEKVLQTESIDLNEIGNEVAVDSTASNSEIDSKMDAVVEKLRILKDMGFELSVEQSHLVDTYEKLHSDEFQQFKANREARELRQQEIRDGITLENERKEMWFNSPENPSNKRIQELRCMRKQIQGLADLRDIAPDLLSDYQNNLVEKGSIFFEMLDGSQSEKHEVDTGMSSEIREWYQEHYTSEENNPGKRI